MDGNQRRLVRPGPSWSGVIGKLCVCVIVAGWGGAGCYDPRISVAQFLQMQQEMRELAAESPSAEELDAVRELIDRRLGPYKVGSSDVLTVTLTDGGVASLFPVMTVRVNRDGQIDLPIVGPVRVGGMELEDVDRTIRNAYVPAVIKDAVVHAELLYPDLTNVLVVGAVTMPGLVPLRRTERNLLFAIVGAGGASDLATGEVTLRRIRRPAEAVSLDLTEPKELRAALALEPLEDGDILTVHAAMPNTIFVGGLVNVPVPQTYPPGVEVSVLQAIAASGGLRTDIFVREGTLIRRMPNGVDVHVKLDLRSIQKGYEANLMLAAGDILWVPHTVETRIQDWINRNVFFRAGATVNYNVTGIEYLNRRSLQSAQRGGTLENTIDPLGFLSQGAVLQSLAP